MQQKLDDGMYSTMDELEVGCMIFATDPSDRLSQSHHRGLDVQPSRYNACSRSEQDPGAWHETH